MTKYAAFSKLTHRSHAIRPVAIFLAAVVFGSGLGAASSISAQQAAKITVEVGRTKSNSVKHPVDARALQIAVAAPAIAKAVYDPNTNRFNFEGSSVGQTRVTIIGTYLKTVAGGNANGGGGMTGNVQQGQRQQTVRYRHIVNVTVVPQAPNPNANAFGAQVLRGKVRDIRIDTLLGPEFFRPSDENKRWRSLRFTFGDNTVALAELAGGSKVRITGVSPGTTRLLLEGERLKNNDWEKTARPILVTVIEDPNAPPPDPWLDGLERAFNQHKNTASRVGTDEIKIGGSIKELRNFGTVVANAIAKERALPKPRRSRLERLGTLRDETRDELDRLRREHAEIAKRILTITWRSDWRDLNIYLGDMPARRTFFCPANPQKDFSHEIYGTGSYLIISKLCVAALHDGALTLGGGNITVEFRQGRDGDKYVGSSQHDVKSGSWERNWGSFVFIKR